MKDLQAALDHRREQGLYRKRRILSSAAGAEVKLNENGTRCFCSNDYLGLANHPEIAQAAISAIEKYGVGSGAAHLICGHHQLHHQLEEELADFLGQERALLFSTGYMANIGVITALTDKHDTVYEDKLNHASLIDAGRYSDAELVRYPHADMENLASRLKNSSAQRKIIVTDGVFSMDGDVAPLKEITQLAKQHRAWTMVDDAHGIGVIGEQGKGSPSHLGLTPSDIDIHMGTLGKAFGVSGAFVAAREMIIETLIQEARTYVYTTAMPPALAAAALTSLSIIKKEDWRRAQLKERIHQFRKGATQLGLELLPSETAIQPIILGDAQKALQWSEALMNKGIWLSAIRPPTVPKGTARLRVTLSASHSEQQVDALLSALEGLCA
ncbi:MAG: 8-amino-7-oxononanoate synthase [Gammaproteobacteria bacterium]|nr:8-amino-7-oxononanoate synthase [Gammaproteobacteria bacterium]